MPGPLPNPQLRRTTRRGWVAAVENLAADRAEDAARDQGATPERPKPPAGLRKAGRALWRKVQEDVDEAFELDAREEAILERACSMADLAADLAADLKQRGRWVEGSTGRQRLSPAVTELRQCETAIATLLSRVEMAPALRTGHLNGRQRNRVRDAAAGRR